MYKYTSTLLISVSLSLLAASPAAALDARTAAVGGSAIANGYGVHGARDNPASLMRMHRKQHRFHFHVGGGVDIQDDAAFIETAIDEDSLLDDLDRELELITGSVLTCDFNSSPETPCLTNTQNISDLATRVADIMTRIDGKPIKATASADIGFAVSKQAVPIALHYRVSVSGSTITDVASGDLAYVNTFATVFNDGTLTFDELVNNAPISVSDDGQTLNVQQAEDVLTSDVEGSVLTRQQFGLSLAASLPISSINIDLGITPKFSSLRAAGIRTTVADQFDDNTSTLNTQFEDSEVTGTAFNIDIGATASLNNLPLRFSLVARNMISESIESSDGFVFETTPQVIVGGAFSFGSLVITSDLALNEAKLDNLETQIAALGVDWSRKHFGLRAGISHDNARTADATALALGFSLGPVHIGGRITDRQSAQVAAQLAYTF